MTGRAHIGPVSEWADTLANHRQWVRGLIANPDTATAFDTDVDTKLAVVVAVAQQLDLENTMGWQALGVVFGDAIAVATGLPWGEITDEYGTDPCLVADARSYSVVFPLTMLSKRAEQGERPDPVSIQNLFDDVSTDVLRLSKQS